MTGGGTSSDSSWSWRLACRDDAERLTSLFALNFGDGWSAALGLTIADLVECDDHRVFLCCLEDDVVIGAIVLSFDKFLHDLCILEEYRGEDRGFSLMKKIVESDWDGKPTTFYSVHDSRVERAGDRFKRLGFKQMAEHFKDDYFIMCRDLVERPSNAG